VRSDPVSNWTLIVLNFRCSRWSVLRTICTKCLRRIWFDLLVRTTECEGSEHGGGISFSELEKRNIGQHELKNEAKWFDSKQFTFD
jgi:hypothetical protein